MSLEHGKLTHSVRGAAGRLDLGESTLWRYIKEGRLKTIHVGGRTLIADDDLRTFIESFRQAEAA